MQESPNTVITHCIVSAFTTDTTYDTMNNTRKQVHIHYTTLYVLRTTKYYFLFRFLFLGFFFHELTGWISISKWHISSCWSTGVDFPGSCNVEHMLLSANDKLSPISVPATHSWSAALSQIAKELPFEPYIDWTDWMVLNDRNVLNVSVWWPLVSLRTLRTGTWLDSK